MSRASYLLLASLIKKNIKDIPQEFIDELCEILQKESPRFQKDMFIKKINS